MVGFWDYTVILTYISVAASAMGIYLSVNEEFFYAIICLLVSGLCDMFDGMVARTKKNRTDDEKSFGIQLDSLADVVCFGVFPATFGYMLCKDTVFAIPSIAVGAIFILCAIIRLAYFNVTEESRQAQTNEKRKHYEGLPVTSIALVSPVLYCFKGLLGDGFPLAYIILLFLVAVAFVIKFKVKKLGNAGNMVLAVLGILIFTILLVLKIFGV